MTRIVVKGKKDGGWLKRSVGRSDVLRTKIENVVLRGVVTEAAKQISFIK